MRLFAAFVFLAGPMIVLVGYVLVLMAMDGEWGLLAVIGAVLLSIGLGCWLLFTESSVAKP